LLKFKFPGQFGDHLTVAIIASQQEIYDDKAASANLCQRINIPLSNQGEVYLGVVLQLIKKGYLFAF